MDSNPTPFALLLQLQRNPRPFTRAQVQQLPRDRQGVYAIWEPPELGQSSDTCTYVGMSTTCIRRRLLDHISDETNPQLRHHLQDFRDHLTFTIVFTTGDTQTRALERHAINTWQPPTNRR